MRIKHYIIEGFCDEEPAPSLACHGTFRMRSYCFFCPEFSYAQSENELAVSDDEGVIAELSDWVGFGGDMCPEKNEEKWVGVWQKICKQKIQEAYQEYMHELKCSDVR